MSRQSNIWVLKLAWQHTSSTVEWESCFGKTEGQQGRWQGRSWWASKTGGETPTSDTACAAQLPKKWGRGKVTLEGPDSRRPTWARPQLFQQLLSNSSQAPGSSSELEIFHWKEEPHTHSYCGARYSIYPFLFTNRFYPQEEEGLIIYIGKGENVCVGELLGGKKTSGFRFHHQHIPQHRVELPARTQQTMTQPQNRESTPCAVTWVQLEDVQLSEMHHKDRTNTACFHLSVAHKITNLKNGRQ